MVKHRTRDFKQSEYSKTIGIKPDRLELIKKMKGKKSASGMLDAIIEYYLINKKQYEGN